MPPPNTRRQELLQSALPTLREDPDVLSYVSRQTDYLVSCRSNMVRSAVLARLNQHFGDRGPSVRLYAFGGILAEHRSLLHRTASNALKGQLLERLDIVGVAPECAGDNRASTRWSASSVRGKPTVSRYAESTAAGNEGGNYEGLSAYSDCLGQRLESFKCADVASGVRFASHVLLSHPVFKNRPTCMVFYTTW